MIKLIVNARKLNRRRVRRERQHHEAVVASFDRKYAEYLIREGLSA